MSVKDVELKEMRSLYEGMFNNSHPIPDKSGYDQIPFTSTSNSSQGPNSVTMIGHESEEWSKHNETNNVMQLLQSAIKQAEDDGQSNTLFVLTSILQKLQKMQ